MISSLYVLYANARRFVMMSVLLMMFVLPVEAQQFVYPTVSSLFQQKGDTMTTLRVEQRSKKSRYILSGADYKVICEGNRAMTRYIRSRAVAVSVNDSLFVNCKRMKYKNYTFGGRYALAYRVQNRIFWSAQPVGQIATLHARDPKSAKLPGEVGDAIQASSLVSKKVLYELDPETGASYFVDKDRMKIILSAYPDLLAEFDKETSESAEVMLRYLLQLK